MPRTTKPKPDVARARESAAEIIRRYGVRAVEHLRLPILCYGERLLVTEDAMSGADARLLVCGRRGVVRVRSSIPYEGQKRFAIAHELGHWRLHPGVSQAHVDTAEQFQDYRNDPVEQEANAFAAALLMPEAMFRDALGKGPLDLTRIREVANGFEVGTIAAARRAVDLTGEDCLLVAHENGRARWWHASPRCSLGPVHPGTEVPSSIPIPENDGAALRAAPRVEWYATTQKSVALREGTIHVPDGPTLTLLSPIKG